MTIIGLPELVVVCLTTGVQADLLSLVRTEDYFQKHGIEVKVSTMLDRAGRAPADAPAQAAQLLAIRWLGEQPMNTRDQRVRELLQQVAEGKMAQDAQGFARDYARRALARLDAKSLPAASAPPNSVRDQGVAWLPSGVQFAACLDMRGAAVRMLTVADERLARESIARGLGVDDGKLIDIADRLGNFEIERCSIAYEEAGQEGTKDKIWVRVTGRADRKRAVELLRDASFVEEKGNWGKDVIILQSEKAAVAFVGDADLLVAAYYKKDKANHLDVVREAIEVRAGKRPGLAKGLLAGPLKEISPNATAMAVGELTQRQREAFASMSRWTYKPRGICLQVARKDGMTVDVRLRMDDAATGKKCRDKVLELKKAAENNFDDLVRDLPGTKKFAGEAKKAMAAVKAYVDDTTLCVEFTLPISLFDAFPDLLKSTRK